ncbi:MAG TPA: dTDP-4-dehydrorhamnose 3,5-epimerase [Sphingomicrobium sp.]|nr:dTDP-4-dehydrorhamnose 3,5-epimerase [Sphingomicrobium sp.]
MEFRTFDIEGPFELTPRKFEDERGYFSETFRLAQFIDRAGPVEFVQDNQSLSARTGTIRGIHFQTDPHPQGKLVRCVAGSVFDVAVDLRRDSPTYGRWVSVILSADALNQLWIPVGFGHAFCTLEPNSVITYRTTDYYSPEHDKGVAWDDADIGIDWPEVADAATLSGKDRAQPALADLPALFSVKGH